MSTNGSKYSKRESEPEDLRSVIVDIAESDWREDSSVTVVVEQREPQVRIEQASSASIRVGVGGIRIRLSQMPPWLAVLFLMAAVVFVIAVAAGWLR